MDSLRERLDRLERARADLVAQDLAVIRRQLDKAEHRLAQRSQRWLADRAEETSTR